jgi:hypothetical protein
MTVLPASAALVPSPADPDPVKLATNKDEAAAALISQYIALFMPVPFSVGTVGSCSLPHGGGRFRARSLSTIRPVEN